MKKVLSLVLCLAMVISACGLFAACGNPAKKTYEIAIVTDVGSLQDGGFNQGTYEGAKSYAEKNKVSYKYYQPANGAEATNDDRITAMRQAVNNGAKVIVAPGFLQATALTTVASEHPEVKFIFIDGFTLNDSNNKLLTNIGAIVYKEQESGFFAGYAAVKEGYTKLGYTGGGDGGNPACNRFGFGFVQGAEQAAKDMNLADGAISMKFSFKYGASFSASQDLQAQIGSWYQGGTQVVFSCGGSMLESVKAAAEANTGAKIIGVDTDQSNASTAVICSAIKGLSASVELALTQFYANEWDAKLGGKAQNLGAAENATGLAIAAGRMTKFTATDYETLFGKVKDGTITINAETPADCNNADWLTGFTKVTVDFEK